MPGAPLLDQHFTLPYVSDFLVSLVPPASKRILEPSAGDGSIADALVRKGFMPDVVEIDPFFSNTLSEKGYNVVGSNFLTFNTDDPYDVIVMNSPFSGGQDSNHVGHALKVSKEVIALVKINIFASKDRFAKIWSHCNLLGFYPMSKRPKFGTFKGTLRHDICVIHLRSLYHCEEDQEPCDFHVLDI